MTLRIFFDVPLNYNAVNLLLSIGNPEQIFECDTDGNLMQGYTKDGYLFTSEYDAENRMTSLEYTDDDGVVCRTEYSYSGDDFLAVIKTYENGELTDEIRIVRDGFLALQDRNGENAILNEYTWGLNLGGGIGGLLNLRQADTNYSYLYDGKGNAEAVLDPSQTLASAYRYDPFGRLLATAGSFEQPFQFSTKRVDALTGLTYYGYRFYSPEMGRWTTRDPLGEAGGINLYAFVGNNSVNWVDSFGLWVCNNSSKPVYFKPAGKNDYPDTTLDESAAEGIAPDSCSLEPYQDGVAIPHHPKYSTRVLKTVNGVNVTVNPDGTVTLSYEGHGGKKGSRALQVIRGGWKKQTWGEKRKNKGYNDWNEIFDKAKTGGECQ